MINYLWQLNCTWVICNGYYFLQRIKFIDLNCIRIDILNKIYIWNLALELNKYPWSTYSSMIVSLSHWQVDPTSCSPIISDIIIKSTTVHSFLSSPCCTFPSRLRGLFLILSYCSSLSRHTIILIWLREEGKLFGIHRVRPASGPPHTPWLSGASRPGLSSAMTRGGTDPATPGKQQCTNREGIWDVGAASCYWPGEFAVVSLLDEVWRGNANCMAWLTEHNFFSLEPK